MFKRIKLVALVFFFHSREFFAYLASQFCNVEEHLASVGTVQSCKLSLKWEQSDS